MTIKIGDRLPEGSFGVMGDDGPTRIGSDELFSGKKVVLFGLPGAFTPTCHRNHLPGFLENIDVIKEKGVDTVACLSVNDVFVMDAWGKSVGANGKIMMLADGNATYTKAIGMDADISAGGMGIRSKRYSMIVEDGVVKTLNIEIERGTTNISGAAALIGQL